MTLLRMLSDQSKMKMKKCFLELLEDDDKEDVKQLLQYNPETAGEL